MTPAAHIVHAVLSLDVGGLERLVLELGRVQLARGLRVTVVCLERPGQLAPAAVAMGLAVLCLNKPPGRSARAVADTGRFLDERPAALVHTHQIGVTWHVGRAAAGRNVPVVHTEHGNPFARAAGWGARLKLRLLYRAAARRAGKVCCVSPEIAAAVGRWRTVPAAKVHLVPNGVAVPAGPAPDGRRVREQWAIPADAVVVGTVGRLHEVKRQDVLLQAVGRLAAALPSVHAVLVGDGPERGRLEAQAAALGLGGRVHFVGYQPQPEPFLAAMDVFALTSRSEGFPVSLLEAWAARRPVVCTSVGGVPAVVTAGADGLLVPPNDGAAVAAALERLARDPALRARFGEAGRATVERKYSLERMAAEYERVYAAVGVGGP